MSKLTLEDKDGVTIVRLGDGKANTLTKEMVLSLADAARQLADGEGGVVLTGEGRFFSAGLDLKEVLEISKEELDSFVDTFEDCFLSWFCLPRPVVAAVNGHAVAGGLVLALTADLRIAGEGDYRIGLNEVPLGISFPTLVHEMARCAVNPSAMSRVMLQGALMNPEQCLEMDILSDVVAQTLLETSAVTVARSLAAAPGQAYAWTKAVLRQDAVARFQAHRGEGKRHFLESITSQPVRDHILATLQAMRNKS